MSDVEIFFTIFGSLVVLFVVVFYIDQKRMF
jgi:hypothetical protein